jgi:hypothetical protein
MKKVLLSAFALCIAGLSFGQTKFGVVAGPSFSSVTTKVNGNKETSDLKVGFRGGFTADIPLADEFYIQPSLLYVGKGSKDSRDFIGGTDISYERTLHYINLPVNFLFKPEVGNGNMLLGVGPYFAYAVGGKFGSNSDDIFKDNYLDGVKRFDSGGNLQVGYEMKSGLNFTLNAEMGFVNLRHDGDSDNAFRNNSFGVSVGYKFGR